MEPLYVLDLEGTTGIYSTSYHDNDIIQLRHGFKELVDSSNQGKSRIAIATRAPRHFVDEIVRNLRKNKVDLNCRIYCEEEVKVKGEEMLYYKDYSQVFKDHGIRHPDEDAVVIGDFLRFNKTGNFSPDDYRNFDFKNNPNVLFTNNSLNDHPLPCENNQKTPVYVVIPQPWTTFEQGKNVTLDLNYVTSFIREVYRIGRGFQEGFELVSNSPDLVKNDDLVNHDGLAKRILGISHIQRYFIIKGKPENWKQLERVM